MTKYQKIFVVAGLCVAFAATAVIVSPGVQADEAVRTGANNVFTGINQFPSIKIGAQGVGGVTFFNGSIVNATTDDAGNDNPVTFGDNVRIDGMLTRGPDADKPVWIGSGLKVDGDVEGIGVSDIDGLQSDLDSKADDGDSYTKTESDGRYYTQTSVDNGFYPRTTADSTFYPRTTADTTFYPRTTADSTFVNQSAPSWTVRTGDLMIPPSACIPVASTGSDYVLSVTPLNQLYPTGGAQDYVCSLQIPVGVTITELEANVHDNSVAQSIGAVTLYRGAFDESTSSGTTITFANTSTSSGDDIVSSGTISHEVTSSNVYYLHLDFSGAGGPDPNGLWYRGARIEYTYTTPY
ncbi:hypothetical protein ACFL2B_00440 [Patescibacteria group bacterium]